MQLKLFLACCLFPALLFASSFLGMNSLVEGDYNPLLTTDLDLVSSFKARADALFPVWTALSHQTGAARSKLELLASEMESEMIFDFRKNFFDLIDYLDEEKQLHRWKLKQSKFKKQHSAFLLLQAHYNRATWYLHCASFLLDKLMDSKL